ncbi:hypothetical protein, variant [Saprolegnia diclina VS20]|uniref:Uncharacterized protein n=1 Tax=Saprolegnia diclina (strain VS20) TaxID=1156394 RepID=T0R258_SAPDV|nr:hypothetical protein SDRG_16054 [Saprolegnia diclina VS20]XP_008620471.1 hypothetical protein, variant [Saprolegnia diclina VS20]EQC26103.1 hypothetical protein SDRG_16054 [Saprolegnia diclina VS20]EQC26104.1 hypothetical protein, variant [Saprolegnia diclina VS20]|eukprot:XP_008620470.1 hypothetical protein SDRG_16054 [Saprolegnia diclina VS20]
MASAALTSVLAGSGDDPRAFVALYTRLIHAQTKATPSARTSRLALQDALVHNPDATTGKRYAVAFRAVDVASLQQPDAALEDMFPDNDVARVYYVLRVLLRALRGPEQSVAARDVFANRSHLLDVQCILCQALARDWLPLGDLVPVLLDTAIGASLFVGVVENDPSTIFVIAEALVATIKKQPTDAHVYAQCRSMLVALSQRSLATALDLRRRCTATDMPVLAAVALDITLSSPLQDAPRFIATMMRGSQAPQFWTFVHDGLHAPPTDNGIRSSYRELLERLRSTLLQALASWAPEHGLFVLETLLRSYCGLLGRGSLQLHETEATALLTVIARALPVLHSPRGTAVVPVAFATLVLACLSKLGSPDDVPFMQEARHGIKALYDADRAASGPAFMMMALLLYTKPSMVVDLLRNVIDCAVVVPVERIPLFGEYVLKLDFTEAVMVHGLLATATPPTIDARTHNVLHEMALRVTYSLLCERSFVRHKANPGDWLYLQVQAATLPLHPILPSLMLEWAENTVASVDPNTQQAHIPSLRAPLVHDTILAVASLDVATHPKAWARAALLLVYALHMNRRSPAKPAYETHTLPIQRIFSVTAAASRANDAFEFVFPLLLRLVLDDFAHALLPAPTQSKLHTTHDVSCPIPEAWRSIDGLQRFMPEVRDALANLRDASGAALSPLVHWLVSVVLPAAMGASLPPTTTTNPFATLSDASSSRTAVAHADVCNLVAPLLLRGLPFHATPDAVYVALARTLCGGPRVPISYPDLLEEPFAVLRCDPVVWTSAALVSLLLPLLNACRRWSAYQVMRSADDASDPAQFVLLQDAVCVHALLDVLDASSGPTASLVLLWLQATFSQNPLLLLTVHSQGYPPALVPRLVRHVPAMEELLASLPDLLNCNDLAKLAFRCELASVLAKEYPHGTASILLKSLLGKLKLIYDTDRATTSEKVLSNDVLSFFASVLPSVGSLSVTFPDMAEESVQLLIKLRVQIVHQSSDLLAANPLLLALDVVVQRVFSQLVRMTPSTF